LRTVCVGSEIIVSIRMIAAHDRLQCVATI